MLKQLRFAPAAAFIDIPPPVQTTLLAGQSSILVDTWARTSLELLDTLPCGVVFRIGKLRLPEEPSRALAHGIAAVLREALLASDAPSAIQIEIDRPQATQVMPGYQSRTLLPHHDGGHCSYLTPSVHHDPSWQPSLRRFSSEGFTTTQAHKLYQGIVIADPGEALSVTTYYNWVVIVRDAYLRATGRASAETAEIAHWLGQNIRRSLALQPRHHSRYLSLPAALGAQDLVLHGLAVHYAEADWTAAEIERFPELARLQPQPEASPTEQLLSLGLQATLGLDWQGFRAAYEVCVPSERFDFLLGHNLTMVHGGLLGGPGRVIEPICFVLDQPQGEQYETWLAQAWQNHMAHGSAFTPEQRVVA